MENNLNLQNMTNLPLSSNQKRLWIISKIDKLNPSYNLYFTYYFKGRINFDFFQKSTGELLKRHYTVFSVFKEVNGEPYCFIEPNPSSVQLVDFSEYPVKERKEKVDSFIAADNRKLFDLEKGPLYRLYLIKVNDAEYYFHGTFHHIIFDGYSWIVLLEDLSRLYNNLYYNQDEKLEPIKLFSYDFARLEKESVNHEIEDELINFWKEYLQDIPSVLKFPYDHPENKNTGFGRNEEFPISASITSRLKEFCREERITEFRLIFAVLGILFHKYTSENDICIGTFLANRSAPGKDKIFGMFVETIPVRFKILEDMSFKDYLTQAKISIKEALKHKDLPFDKIVDASKTERIPSINPIFQFALSWWKTLTRPMTLGESIGEFFPTTECVSPFNMNFHIWEGKNSLNGEIEYNIDKFERKTIIRFKDSFLKLLQCVLEYPDLKISDYSITPEEDLRFINEWNNTDAFYESNLCVHQKFEKQAIKEPDAVAILTKDLSLTYKEFNEHANRMANYLISQNVKTEDKIGICMARSAEMMICIFGVLKAGAAYLPLDPENPTERLKSIVKDAKPRLIITTRDSKANIPEGIQLVLADDIIKNPLSGISINPDVNVASRNLAYVIYTSGSTGIPKGAMIEHHSVLNRLGWMQKAYPLNKTDTLIQKTPTTFDVSVWELFWWSFNGARLVLLPKGGEKEPETIIQYISDYNVTTIHFVPSMFVAFFEMLKTRQSFDKLKSLRRIFLSGEALPLKIVREFNELRASYSLPDLINLYGPTEATVDVSYFDCPKKDINNVFIGRPIDNTKLFVVNNRNMIQPVGVPGELIITGVNLGRGYLNNPALTNEKFFDFRISEENIVRAYRTGDLVKLTPEGELDYLGRLDNQVKIRGFRIELGDIESKIMEHPQVNNCAVIVDEKVEPKSLIAYICLKSGAETGEGNIRTYLSGKLPDYMVPPYIVFLEKLPLTSSGKLDRKNLPRPARDKSKDIITAPSNTTEKKILDLWKSLIKTENVSVSDNFFDVGGDSLLAIHLAALISKEFDMVMNTITVFEFPTIKGQSDFLTGQTDKQFLSSSMDLEEKSKRRRDVEFKKRR